MLGLYLFYVSDRWLPTQVHRIENVSLVQCSLGMIESIYFLSKTQHYTFEKHTRIIYPTQWMGTTSLIGQKPGKKLKLHKGGNWD